MKRIAAIVIGIAACLVFGVTLWRSVVAGSNSGDETAAANQPNSATVLAASSTLPVRLIIPKIGVNAKMQYVGISKHGTMAVPTNYTDVGWYRNGAMPGHAGTAVIDGHLDNGLGMNAVFKRLGELQPGDSVFVTDRSGKQLRFVVTRTEELQATATSTGDVFASSAHGEADLNLITCEGTWIPSQKMYSNRRVVFTALAPQQ